MRNPRRISPPKLALISIVLAFALDAWTKTLVLQYLEPTPHPMGGAYIAIMPVTNDALVFSIGAGHMPPGVLLVLRIALLAGVLWLLRRDLLADTRLAFGTALLAAGGLGNTIDILWRDGGVIDFLLVGQVDAWVREAPGAFVTALNLADIWIFMGLGLLYPAIRRFSLDVRDGLLRLILQEHATVPQDSKSSH